MTPKQKLALAARQASEQVSVLSAWLDQNGRRVGAGEPSLREALVGYAGELDDVQQALERPVGVGLVSSGGDGQGWLVSAFLGIAEGRNGAGQRKGGHDAVRTLLSGDTGDGRAPSNCASVRITEDEVPGRPDGYPFAIGLLGLADLVAIFVRVYYASFPGADSHVPDRQKIAALYEDVGRNLAAAAVPGLPERDVHALRKVLAAQHPEAAGLRMLSALGYWEDLADVCGHLQTAERNRVLALLWGEQEELTRLFEHLSEALSRLAFGTEAFCPREAVVMQGATSGWVERHPRGIIGAGTLEGLGDEADEQVRVVGRYGHRATLTRGVLAALVAEVLVPTTVPPLAGAPAADLIVFPALSPPQDLALPLTGDAVEAGYDPRESMQRQLARALAHAKAMHLFERAVRRGDLTGLVVGVDPGLEPDDALASGIGDWIERCQGATPAAREFARTGLFVVATKAHNPAGVREGAVDTLARQWRNGLEGAIGEAVGGALGWTKEWVPGRPFGNIYLFQHPDGGLQTGSMGGPSVGSTERRAIGADMLRALFERCGTPRHYDLDRETIERSLASSDGGAGLLLGALAGVAQPGEKHRHLQRRVAGISHAIRTRLGRLNAGEDVSDVADWRRRIATVVEHRVERTVSRGRLGVLLSALGVGEVELRALFWRTRLGDGDPGVFDEPIGGADNGNDADDRDVEGDQIARLRPRQGRIRQISMLAMSYWAASMRRAAGTARLNREIGFTEPVAQFVVDEIALGAERLGLERRLSEALTEALERSGNRRPDALFASCASPIINGFVERLEIEAPATSSSRALARVRARGPFTQQGAGTSQLSPIGALRPLGLTWCEALGVLIEGNIAASRFRSAGDSDPELTRLLARVGAERLEAEL